MHRSPWHFRGLQAVGARALTEGLSTLPSELTPSSTTALAYWSSESFGFVIFLAGSPTVDGELKVWTGSYDRTNDEWTPILGACVGRRTREEFEGPWEPATAETMDGNAITLRGRVVRDPTKKDLP
jgi:hypothetical protein